MTRKFYELWDKRINDMISKLRQGYMKYQAVAADVTLTLAPTFINVTAASAIVIPDANADNEGKVYRFLFTADNSSKTIKNVTGANVVTAANMTAKAVIEVISTGTAWAELLIVET